MLPEHLRRDPHLGLLGGHGDSYDVYKHTERLGVVLRQPLVQSPRSTSRYNFGLLPAVPHMAGMDLAYRFEVTDPSNMAWFAKVAIVGACVTPVIKAVVFLAAGLFLSPYLMACFAAVIAIMRAGSLVWNRSVTSRAMLYTIASPAIWMLAAAAVARLFESRMLVGSLAGVTALALLARHGMQPLQFYVEWLYTHPRLRPATRRTTPALPPPDYLLLLTALTAALLLPQISTTLALAVLAVLPLLAIYHSRLPLQTLMKQGASAIVPYAMYGGLGPKPPGIWQASTPYHVRDGTLSKMVGALFLTLAISLNLFMPLVDFPAFTTPTQTKDRTPSKQADRTAATQSKPAKPATARPKWRRDGRPHQWVLDVIDAAWEMSFSPYLFGVPVALVAAMVLPPMLLVGVYRRPLEAIGRLRADIEGGPGARPVLDIDERPEWQWYVDRSRDSAHEAPGPFGDTVREAEHLFLGVEPHSRFPVLLDEKLLAEHTYLVGDSGSGKTSLGLMPLIIQLLRGHRPSDENANAGRVHGDGRSPPPPLVVIDLKGDPALFHTTKKEAEERGLEFRFFTPERGRASHYFNPFASLDARHRTEIQLCQILLDALSLNHGEGYGRGYYSRQSRALLHAALTAEKKPRSLKDLHELILALRETHRDEYKDTLELLSTVHALTQYKALALRTNTKKPEEAIHMPSMLERRQVVYFWLPAAVESVSAREIAKLALYSLLTACIDRQRTHPHEEWRQAYVVIDEFQRIAGENFRVILEQARSFGLGIVLANQSVSDLQTPTVDLRGTVRANTRVKRYFSVTDPRDVAALSEASGQEIAYFRSWNAEAGYTAKTEYVGSSYNSRSESQSLKPRLLSNDILAISDHPLESILHVSRGSGYTQFAGLPLAVRCTWPMTRAEYRRRQHAPWPTREEYEDGTTTASDKSPHDIERERDAEVRAEAHARLQGLLAQGT